MPRQHAKDARKFQPYSKPIKYFFVSDGKPPWNCCGSAFIGGEPLHLHVPRKAEHPERVNSIPVHVEFVPVQRRRHNHGPRRVQRPDTKPVASQITSSHDLTATLLRKTPTSDLLQRTCALRAQVE